MTGGRGAGTVLSLALLLAIAMLLTLEIAQPWSSLGPSPWPLPPAGQTPYVKLGVTTPALARNSATMWQPSDLGEINAFEHDARSHADIVMWFSDWKHVSDFDPQQAAAVAARGSVPDISWEPWDSSRRLGTSQPDYRLSTIIDGAHDTYIRRWAREIAAYKKPVLLRFAQEMNGRSYPWAEGTNGNQTGQFVKAWNHVHAIFDKAGADNVTWIWAPVVGDIPTELYPGPGGVDVIGLSGFVADKSVFGSAYRSFAAAFGPSLDALHALAPDKPISLAEIAAAEAGGDKAQWITQMFQEISRRTYVRSLVWFNVRKEADWPIESSASAEHAFATGLTQVVKSSSGT